MILRVSPTRFIVGKIFLPPSKSYTIRAFLIAALGGRSRIVHPSYCDDALVALRTAKFLGAKVTAGNKSIVKVSAVKKPFLSAKGKINVGESGTVLRLLLPMASLTGRKIRIDGRGTLRGRPNFHLTQVLRNMGVDISGQGQKESVPIIMKGGTMKGGKFSIDGSLSSQFISALLITCPLLKENSTLRISGKKVVSSTYITMTLRVLEKSGISVVKRSPREFYLPGRQVFRGLKTFCVPSDYGLAAFMMAAAVLTQSKITLTGYLDTDYIQSDAAILPLLRAMGVKFSKTDTKINIMGPCALKGGTFSLKDCPDLLPIMTVLAMFADRPTRFYGIGHARVKESDRISDLRIELLKVGAKIKEERDAIVVFPQKEYRHNVTLDPHHDHRLAMSFAVLGIKLGVLVKDIECVRKSYPEFVRDFKNIGVRVFKSRN